MKRKSIGILTGAENLCSDYKSWNKRGLHHAHTLEAIRIIADRSTSGSRAPSLEALWRIIISDGGWGILALAVVMRRIFRTLLQPKKAS